MLCLSKQPATKTQLSKFAGERGSQPSRVPVVTIKTEPIDTNEGLSKHLSSPIVISSSEDEGRTPKAKPGKGKNFPSSLTEQDFIRTPRPAPRRKGKEAAVDAEEPVVDLPGSSQPLSETTVYLEDM